MRTLAFGLFAALSLLVALATLRILAAPMELEMPDAAYYRPTAAAQMWAHIVLGPLVLALAPLQVWVGLRRAVPRLHRALGYVYVVGVVGAGLASLAMLPSFRGSLWAALGFAMLAILWIGFTLQAVRLARARRPAEHRVWMLRSVALTFAAVTLRLMMAPLMVAGWSSAETYDITGWASWLLNLAVLELLILRRAAVARA